MEDSGCSVSLSNLICLEDGTRLDQEEEDEEEAEKEMLVLWDDQENEEYIEMLVSRESSFESGSRTQDTSSGNGFSMDWMRCARSDAIQWILKMKSCFDFRVQTAYLAVSYLDRFLARRSIDEGKSWAVYLVSIACLSLAAKMEECRARALSEFRMEEYHFDSHTIQRMELLVLNTLEWRMSSVTPFSYMRHFISKFPFEKERKDILSKAIGFIFATIEGINLVDYRPSAIAAAAILAASDQRLTKKMVEAKMRPVSLEPDPVYSCYSMMIQESHQRKLNPSMILASSDQSTDCASINSSIDVIATDSFATRRNKRRRL